MDVGTSLCSVSTCFLHNDRYNLDHSQKAGIMLEYNGIVITLTQHQNLVPQM